MKTLVSAVPITGTKNVSMQDILDLFVSAMGFLAREMGSEDAADKAVDETRERLMEAMRTVLDNVSWGLGYSAMFSMVLAATVSFMEREREEAEVTGAAMGAKWQN
jgi:hypothetical protein